MQSLAGQIALVTGASRGIGKGIALALGDAGATVYLTGRTVDEAQAAVPLPGTIHQTAAEVTRRGGTGIAVRCDHRADSQVQAVIDQIRRDHGQLDILVNNAWAGYEGYVTGTHYPPNHPFWEKPLSYWDDNLDGVRWAYVASALAVPLLIPARGLIVNLSFPAPLGNPPYGVAKTAVDRLTVEIAQQVQPHQITVVSLYPGLVRTENVLANAQYFDLSNSESPEFTGRAIVALAADPQRLEKTGKTLVVARLAQDYAFDDIDGKRPTPEF